MGAVSAPALLQRGTEAPCASPLNRFEITKVFFDSIISAMPYAVNTDNPPPKIALFGERTYKMRRVHFPVRAERVAW